jgi:hypothetical protein
MGRRVLLDHVGIMTMDAARHQYNHGAILIDGDRISQVGPSAELAVEALELVERADLRGRWILPGLINTHVHTSQQLGRGLADDVDLLTWLHDRIWPYESSLTEEDSYVSSLLCGIEQIRSGVTCFAEAGGQFVNGMGRAVSRGFVDQANEWNSQPSLDPALVMHVNLLYDDSGRYMVVRTQYSNVFNCVSGLGLGDEIVNGRFAVHLNYTPSATCGPSDPDAYVIMLEKLEAAAMAAIDRLEAGAGL